MNTQSRWAISMLAASLVASAVASGSASGSASAAPPIRQASSAVTYTYDQLGRLSSVAVPGQGSATYTYDAVGNITGVTRGATPPRSSAAKAGRRGPPEVTGISPDEVAAGGRFTVSGRAFSTDPSRDVVRVGGLFARVVSATASRLVVESPPGSVGGTIEVNTPGGVARSRSALRDPGMTGPAMAPPALSRHARDLPFTAPVGVTALTGQVLTVDDSPLAGVTLSVDSVSTVSAADGRFLLSGLTPGHHELQIDGSTVAGPASYGYFEEAVDLADGTTTVLPWKTWMPALDTADAVTLPSPTTSEVVVRNPHIPGMELRIPKGTVIHDRFGGVVHQITVTRMPVERTPFPLAPGMPIFFSVQPGGATLTGPGIEAIYPNVTNQPPRVQVDFVDNDGSRPGSGWRTYGRGTVSADGRQIVPAARVRLTYLKPFGVTYNPLCQFLGLFCPRDGNGDGDPVDLSTGLVVASRTDLYLPDVKPIAVTRTYRQNDYTLRPFGIGQSDALDLFVSPDGQGNYDLGLPNGGSIQYSPTSTTNVYRSANSPTSFFDSTLKYFDERDFTITLKDGTVYTFGTHNVDLIGVSDRFGNTISITRDYPTGEIQQVTSPNGRWMKFTWGVCTSSNSVCITSVTDNIGRTVSYGYDPSGRLTSMHDPSGGLTTYGWSPCTTNMTCTQLLTITDPRLITYLTNAYDPATGRITSQTQADAGKYNFSYILNGNGFVTETDVTNPIGTARRVGFDANGFTTSDTFASGTSIQQANTYNRDLATNLVNSATDALGRTTAYTYDPSGNLLTLTRLSGTSQATTDTLSYEPVYNRVATVTDPLGHTGTFTYDDANQTISVTDPLGHATTTTFIHGQPVAVANPNQQTTYLSYLYGDLVALADPLGRVATRYLDAAGRLLETADPLGSSTNFTYDSLNQLLTTTDPLNGQTSSTYDPDGNQLTLTDQNHHTTAWTYDNMNRVATRTDPLTKADSFSYDGIGDLTGVTDRNGAIDTFVPDALGRTTSAVFGGSGAITYTYDAANRLTQAADPVSGTSVETWDNLDRLTNEATPRGMVTYTYDGAGRRTTMGATGQTQVAYGYDNANRLTSITQGTATAGYTYDAAERITAYSLPTGVTATNTFDVANQLTKRTFKAGATTLGSISYTYDGDGRRISESGSLAAVNLPAAVTSSNFNADNELTSLNGTAYSYDNVGQLLSDGSSTFQWNARHQLSAVTGPSSAGYTYDPFGRRVTQTAATTTTSYLFDHLNVIQEAVGGTATAKELAGSAIDQTITRSDSTGNHALLTDALGDTVGLTSSTGTLGTTYAYTPYGQSTAKGTASGNPIQFTGRQQDATGLVFSRSRYYSPTLGRFISQDPIGMAGGTTDLYSYAADAPTNFTDPLGTQLLAGCVIGAVFNVGFDWALTALSGRKYTLGQGLQDAAVGCISGAVGAWIGEALAGAEAAGEGAQAARQAATGDGLLEPGPWAADSVPSSAPGKITQAERDLLNPIGDEYGCHSCGATDPGTQSGNWVGDHQPVSRTVPPGTPQELYPQCLSCSNQQGLWIINLIRQGLL